MPREQKEAEAALTNLGQRVRAGHAKQQPISERSLETVRNAVTEQYEQERRAKLFTPRTPPKSKGKGRGHEPEI